MARRTVYVDDLTGEEGAEPVLISVDGDTYSVDLGSASREKLDKALAPFLEVATRTSSAGRSGRGARKSARSSSELQAIREWARSKGKSVSDRGRIPNSIIEEYQASR